MRICVCCSSFPLLLLVATGCLQYYLRGRPTFRRNPFRGYADPDTTEAMGTYLFRQILPTRVVQPYFIHPCRWAGEIEGVSTPPFISSHGQRSAQISLHRDHRTLSSTIKEGGCEGSDRCRQAAPGPLRDPPCLPDPEPRPHLARGFSCYPLDLIAVLWTNGIGMSVCVALRGV